MKPRNVAIACGVAGVAAGLATATGIVYRKQIKSVASLKRLTDYADGYDLYSIDIAYDYDLDRIIAADVRDDQAYIDAVLAQVLPGVPAHVQAPQFACSAFAAVDAEGRVRTGRNYDFKEVISIAATSASVESPAKNPTSTPCSGIMREAIAATTHATATPLSGLRPSTT